MSTKNNELAKKESAELQEIPDFLRPHMTGHQAGMENVDQSDMLMPRLGLCQSLSPQRRKTDPAFIPGLEEGHLFNTVSQEIYGTSLQLVALFFFKNRIKYFPLDEGGGIDCNSPNAIDGGRISPIGCGSCRYSSWGNGQVDDEHGNDAPECTLYHNFMSFLPFVSFPTPIAVSYKATGLKLSKQLLSSIRVTRMPMYAKVYDVSVVEMQKDKNVWFEKKITPGRFLDKELFTRMDELFQELHEKDIKIDTTGEAAEQFDHGDNTNSAL